MGAVATVLLNRSSRGADPVAIANIERLLAAAPFASTLSVVSGEDLVATARRAVSGGSTLLIAAGGDGTVSATASVAAADGVVLGVLPLGTLNHFAHDLGLSGDPEIAIRTIADGHMVEVDVGDVNGHIFLNNSSIGLYPRLVSEREARQRRGRRKWTALALAAFRIWRQYRRINVTVEGHGYRRNVRTPFVFVGNNEYTIEGGRIDARTSLAAGRLQLCMAPDASRRRMMHIVIAALLGRVGTVDGFEALTARSVTITGRSRHLGVSLDGEVAVLASPLRYTIRPQALRVIVPAERGER